jgi:DNA glycosylase AlkZ-like
MRGRAEAPVLTTRRLNRALLERQRLLRRVPVPPLETVEHLGGMQAQAPLVPYFGLWARLAPFDAGELSAQLADRRVVRAVAMHRTTIHLVSAADALAMRPVLQVVDERAFRAGTPFGRSLAGLDVASVIDAGRDLLTDRPRSTTDLARLLGERWPDRPATSLGFAVRYLVPLVQVPPRGLWDSGGQAVLAPTEAWLGRPLGEAVEPDAMILRYLGAFGPASVRDFQAWTWLTRTAPAFDRLRPRLRTFRDERGVELFDLPEAPLPDADVPAPPRFLPEYDNVLLSHADRSRIAAEPSRLPLPASRGGRAGTLLVDGFFEGTWRVSTAGPRARLDVAAFRRLAPAERTAVADEGAAMLAFGHPGYEPEVRVGEPA